MQNIDLSSIQKKNHVIKPVIDKPRNVPVNPKGKQPVEKPPTRKAIREPDLPKEEPANLTAFDRSKTIKLLEIYLVEFPEELVKYKGINFTKCKDEELRTYKDHFEKSVSSTNNLSWGVEISQHALSLYEMLGKMGGLEIDGVSKIGTDPAWIKNVKAVCLKYMDGGITFVEPEHQLLFMLFQSTAMAHFMNSSTKGIERAPVNSQAAVIEEVPKKSETQVKLELQQLNQEFNDI